MPLKTDGIIFLPSRLRKFCTFTEIKKQPFAVSISVMIMASKGRKFFCVCYFVNIKIDAGSITENGCHVPLFSAAMLFVFSGDVCITMQCSAQVFKRAGCHLKRANLAR